MARKIALGLSVLLHPLLIPTAGIIILLYSGSYISSISVSAKKMLILLFASGTLLIPAMMILLFYMRGLISDLHLVSFKERTTPLAITLIFYILTFFLFLKIPVYRFMHGFMLGSALSVLFTLLINFKWKISIHMIGMGGLTSFILMISVLQNINLFTFLVLTILASGLTGSSRLYLKAHTSGQVYSGYLLGFMVMGGCLLFY